MITFAIPTWNRAEKLKVAVTSIAEQIVRSNSPCRIVISDNASTDSTREVAMELAARWPFIIYGCLPIHVPNYAENLKNALAGAQTEYVWLFGDDDILQPGALDLALRLVSEHKPGFVHCGRVGKTLGDNRAIVGAVAELCGRLGWLEVTGLMTSCLARTQPMRLLASSPYWEKFSHNPFTHACAILGAVGREKAVFADIPMVAFQDADEAGNFRMTEETYDRWINDGVFVRFFNVTAGLQEFMKGGMLKDKLPVSFFRYRGVHLWDHLLATALYLESCGNNLPAPLWEQVRLLADHVADETVTKDIKKAVDAAQKAATALHKAKGKAAKAKAGTAARTLMDTHNARKYPVAVLGDYARASAAQ